MKKERNCVKEPTGGARSPLVGSLLDSDVTIGAIDAFAVEMLEFWVFWDITLESASVFWEIFLLRLFVGTCKLIASWQGEISSFGLFFPETFFLAVELGISARCCCSLYFCIHRSAFITSAL